MITETTAETAATLNITGLYYPRGEVRSVQWDAMAFDSDSYDLAQGEGWPGRTYTYAEAFDFEHDGETFPMIAQDGYAVAVIVDGTPCGASALEQGLEDATDEAIAHDRSPAEDPQARAWQARLDALEAAQDDTPSQWGSEGPMMNYFYPVSDYTPGDMEEWAAKLDGLPLCVVELDGERGLALTGGGMDLSWEIAEAFIRLGYYPPTWIDLPAMAGRGTSEKDRAIARALATHYRAESVRLERRIAELIERYNAAPFVHLTD